MQFSLFLNSGSHIPGEIIGGVGSETSWPPAFHGESKARRSYTRAVCVFMKLTDEGCLTTLTKRCVCVCACV